MYISTCTYLLLYTYSNTYNYIYAFRSFYTDQLILVCKIRVPDMHRRGQWGGPWVAKSPQLLPFSISHLPLDPVCCHLPFAIWLISQWAQQVAQKITSEEFQAEI